MATASPEPGGVGERLADMIAESGPIPVALFMAEANAHYYAARDPLGAAGDFVTAPEISQMFGELVGLALADSWARAGAPPAAYVELGPGRGTLAADALRAMAAAGLTPPVHFVETSPVLRARQAERVPHALWHQDVAQLPGDRPLLVVANEFFDALPVRQLARTARGWRELLIDHGAEGFRRVAGAVPMDEAVPVALRDAAEGSVFELSPASEAVMATLAARLVRQGGVLLVIDYGHAEPGLGDTLQAVRGHRFADAFAAPGEQDLTAHVDFTALAEAATAEGAVVSAIGGQGAWLDVLGIGARAEALSRRHPQRANEVARARRRLCDPAEMGALFKVMAVSAPGWPGVAGLELL